jgi:hypothetical protein
LGRNNGIPPNNRHSTCHEATRPQKHQKHSGLHALTEFKDDEYVCKVAKTVEEASQLIESGFEHVCAMVATKPSEIANEPFKNSLKRSKFVVDGRGGICTSPELAISPQKRFSVDYFPFFFFRLG